MKVAVHKYLLAVLACFVVVSKASIGVDISQLYNPSDFQCLKDNDRDFAIIRCYQSVGKVDPNCAQNVANAWDGGMSYVDLYMFPCPTCGDAANQINELAAYLNDNNVQYGQLWLDIEGADYWLGDAGANQAFASDLFNAANQVFGDRLAGVYCNRNGWESIFGEWQTPYQGKLWWASWNGSPSWAGWQPFDGFNTPTIRQYEGDTELCGMSVDLDFY